MTEIKICGITMENEARKLVELQVEYAGFILFFPKSRRNISIEQGEAIIKYLKNMEKGSDIKTVAVTVSPTIEQVREIEAAGFDILQVHNALFDNVKENCHLPIFRAINIASGEDNNIENIIKDEKIAGLVLDGAIAGGGRSFKWREYENMDRGSKLLILAGGLNAENVREAIEIIKPDVVDVSSGVEYDVEGKTGKNPEKIEKFVKIVREKN